MTFSSSTRTRTICNSASRKSGPLWASLGLELNEKTQIFPIRNGIDFLGFDTYLTEEGKVIRKLRHSSIKRMRSKLRRWEQDYPAGLVTREKILQSWQAWTPTLLTAISWSLRSRCGTVCKTF